MLSNPAVETYDTWLQWRPGGDVDVHCGGPDRISARVHSGHGATAWTPERLLLAALELAVYRQFLRESEGHRVQVVAYESNAFARVRPSGSSSTLLDLSLSLYVGVKTQGDARRAEQIVEGLAEEPLLGLAIHAPRQIKAVIEVLTEGRRRTHAHPLGSRREARCDR